MFKKISAALLSAAVIAAGIPAGIPVGRRESVPAADLFDLQIAESGTLQDGGTYQLPLTFSGSYSAENRTAANATAAIPARPLSKAPTAMRACAPITAGRPVR